MNLTPRKAGIAQTALSGFFFGFLGIFGKALFSRGVTPGELLSFRFLLAAMLLWPILLIRLPGRWKLTPGQIALCAGLGIGGYALFSSCFFMALQGLSASLAVLLLYTYPVMVSGAAWLLWGDRIPRRKWPALPLTMIGMLLLVWGQFSAESAGALLFGIGSAVFYSVYILASSRFLRGIPPLVSVTYILSFAGLALGALHLRDPVRVTSLLLENWPVLAGVVLVGTVGAMSLFLAGLQRLHAWEVSLLSTLEPVTGIALAAVLLGERLSLLQGAGAAAVLCGMALISAPERD